MTTIFAITEKVIQHRELEYIKCDQCNSRIDILDEYFKVCVNDIPNTYSLDICNSKKTNRCIDKVYKDFKYLNKPGISILRAICGYE